MRIKYLYGWSKSGEFGQNRCAPPDVWIIQDGDMDIQDMDIIQVDLDIIQVEI